MSIANGWNVEGITNSIPGSMLPQLDGPLQKTIGFQLGSSGEVLRVGRLTGARSRRI